MKHYLSIWLASTAAALVLIGMFNGLVDPYGIFRLVDQEGVNRIKPAAANQGAMAKAYSLMRQQPRTLIIGNSRSEVGFDPLSPEWLADTKPVFNAALPGTGTATSLAYFRHFLALANKTPSAEPTTLVWGIDFMDFLVDGGTPTGSMPPTRRNGRLLVDPDGASSFDHWERRLRDYVEASFTLTATLDSLQTLTNQRNPYAAQLTSQGFNPMRDYERIAADEGYWTLFRQRDQSNVKAYLKRPTDIYEHGRNSSEALDHLREVLALSRSHGVRVKLVIYPYHARLLEIIRITGHWSGFEEWKRALVKVVEASNAGQGNPAELWDFSGFNEYTMEVVPSKGDRAAKMLWYWEAGHFKRALGDRVIERVFSNEHTNSAFGLRISSDNIEQHLANMQFAAVGYRTLFPDAVRSLMEFAGHSGETTER